MTDSNDDIDMTLGSGIAAFEAKHFARATELLSGLAEDGEPILDLTDRRPIIDLTVSPSDEQLSEFLRRRAEADRRLAEAPPTSSRPRRGLTRSRRRRSTSSIRH